VIGIVDGGICSLLGDYVHRLPLFGRCWAFYGYGATTTVIGGVTTPHVTDLRAVPVICRCYLDIIPHHICGILTCCCYDFDDIVDGDPSIDDWWAVIVVPTIDGDVITIVIIVVCDDIQ